MKKAHSCEFDMVNFSSLLTSLGQSKMMRRLRGKLVPKGEPDELGLVPLINPRTGSCHGYVFKR